MSKHKDPPELLARLNNCKSPSDPQDITWEMVAMAKHRMKREVSLYAEAKYQNTGDGLSRPQMALYRLLYQKVYMPRELGGTGIAKKYDLPASITEGLCQMSVSEDLGHNRCPVCLGKGDAYIPQRVECETCDGSGKIRYTAEKIAGELGCTKRHYFRRWSDPHSDIRSVLSDWDRKVWAVMRRFRSDSRDVESQVAWHTIASDPEDRSLGRLSDGQGNYVTQPAPMAE